MSWEAWGDPPEYETRDCSNCNGTGFTDGLVDKCPVCEGTGEVVVEPFSFEDDVV